MYDKLVKIQSGLKVPKNQLNKFGNYKYRNCEDILEALKPLLAKQELYLIITDDIVMIGERTYVKAVATLSDGVKKVESSGFAREPLIKKGMDESQITGAASSYARKYALNGLFCIDDTKDADSLSDKDGSASKNRGQKQTYGDRPSQAESKKPQDKPLSTADNKKAETCQTPATMDDLLKDSEGNKIEYVGAKELKSFFAQAYGLGINKEAIKTMLINKNYIEIDSTTGEYSTTTLKMSDYKAACIELDNLATASEC